MSYYYCMQETSNVHVSYHHHTSGKQGPLVAVSYLHQSNNPRFEIAERQYDNDNNNGTFS